RAPLRMPSAIAVASFSVSVGLSFGIAPSAYKMGANAQKACTTALLHTESRPFRAQGTGTCLADRFSGRPWPQERESNGRQYQVGTPCPAGQRRGGGDVRPYRNG